MPKVKSLEDLRRIREETQRKMRIRDETSTRIIVGMGTCGIAAGAREVMHAIMEELDKRDIEAAVSTVGCIGLCVREPLVDIERAGQTRVSYGNVTPDMVPRLIEEHLLKGNVVEEWVVGRVEETES